MTVFSHNTSLRTIYNTTSHTHFGNNLIRYIHWINFLVWFDKFSGQFYTGAKVMSRTVQQLHSDVKACQNGLGSLRGLVPKLHFTALGQLCCTRPVRVGQLSQGSWISLSMKPQVCFCLIISEWTKKYSWGLFWAQFCKPVSFTHSFLPGLKAGL